MIEFMFEVMEGIFIICLSSFAICVTYRGCKGIITGIDSEGDEW